MIYLSYLDTLFTTHLLILWWELLIYETFIIFWWCSQCDEDVALEKVILQLNHSPVKLGWLGSGCSVATAVSAALNQLYNLTQVFSYPYSCVMNSPTSSKILCCALSGVLPILVSPSFQQRIIQVAKTYSNHLLSNVLTEIITQILFSNAIKFCCARKRICWNCQHFSVETDCSYYWSWSSIFGC